MNASVIADQLFDEGLDQVELGHVQASDVYIGANSGSAGRLLQFFPPCQVAHGGDNLKSTLGQLNGGQKANAAGRAGITAIFVDMESNYIETFVYHGSRGLS